MQKRHRIQFPKRDFASQQQDETYFFLQDGTESKKIRFHDYHEIFATPGLYEQLFYDRLKCVSPDKVASILESSIKQSNDQFTELRVLDLGAGNGMMGEELKNRGAARMIGVDIIPEAYDATLRDRPDVYDAYYTQDLTALDDDQREEFKSWDIDCLVTVAALGFGDIPVKAFTEAFNLVKDGGWIAFNIRDTFFDESDKSGFSKMMRELVFSEHLSMYHIERYRHRLSIDGEPLFYYAIVGRKNSNIAEASINDSDNHVIDITQAALAS